MAIKDFDRQNTLSSYYIGNCMTWVKVYIANPNIISNYVTAGSKSVYIV